MAKSKEVKSLMLKEISENLEGAESVVIAEYSGLDVSGMTLLRKKSLIYGFSSDPVAPAKLLVDYSKDNNAIVVKGGALPGALLDIAAVNSLAAIPPRDRLYGILVGTMQAPISGFVRTLNEVPSGLVRVLSAVLEAKQAQS